MFKPKLTDAQWKDARDKWEADNRTGFDWLAKELIIVTRQAISKKAKQDGWTKGGVEYYPVESSPVEAVETVVAQPIKNIVAQPLPIVAQPSSGERLTLKEMAGQYTEAAVVKLGELLFDSETPKHVLVNVCKEILDRAHGKATQSVEVSGEVAMVADHALDEIYQAGMQKIEEMKVQQAERVNELRKGALH